jgi:hypothetical protein
MKNEDAFNAKLGKEIRKRVDSGTYCLKMAEKFHIGIADFQLVRAGQTVVFEAKFIAQPLPARATKVLKHPFTGPQITYLRGMNNAGAKTYGVIGMNDTKMIKVLPSHMIPAGGNWSLEDWGTFHHNIRLYDFWDVVEMVDYMFNPDKGSGFG